MPRLRNQGRKIDFKQWSSIPAVTNTLTGATTQQGGALSFLVSATILRIRGYVQAHFMATVQVGDEIQLAFGLAVVSTDAFTAGAGSMPDPFGDPEFPWLWWGQIQLESISVAASAVNNGGWGLAAQRLEVDSKAMRKMKLSEFLVWINQANSPSGSPDITVILG